MCFFFNKPVLFFMNTTYTKCLATFISSIISQDLLWTKLAMISITLLTIITAARYRTDTHSIAQFDILYIGSNGSYFSNQFVTRNQGVNCSFPALWILEKKKNINIEIIKILYINIRWLFDEHQSHSYFIII